MGRPRHHVPEGVIHGILRLLPTIPAARMSFLSKQWEGLRSLGCVLDFVEDNLDGELDDRPRNFINTCDRYLDQFRECDKISIHKFRLHMRYSSEDANMVDEWLNFAVERGVKELDINLPSGGYSLKHVLISGAKHLRNFELYGCKDNVKATIITRNMSLSMSGFLKSSSLDPELWEARITLPDTELPAFDCSSKHFSSLRDYLECFDCFKEITLEVDDAKALIFPENFRQTRSPPLLNLNILEVTSKVSASGAQAVEYLSSAAQAVE
ncbi:hypothetical protein TB2_045641 [Malus domestica]